jgi:hypothetical protein
VAPPVSAPVSPPASAPMAAVPAAAMVDPAPAGVDNAVDQGAVFSPHVATPVPAPPSEGSSA